MPQERLCEYDKLACSGACQAFRPNKDPRKPGTCKFVEAAEAQAELPELLRATHKKLDKLIKELGGSTE
jgi:hypothetical protein